MPRPDYGAVRALRHSPGSEALLVSEVSYTDSPQVLRRNAVESALVPGRPPSSEAPSRLGDAFQDTEAMSFRRFQSVISLKNSDALSGDRHTIGSAPMRPLRSEMPSKR